jgi:diguanylate cyclase (GGDEF)-like protein
MRWLVGTGQDVPAFIQALLIRELYGTLPIFIGGVANTLVVSCLVAARNPTWPFLLWAGFELGLALVRTPLLIIGQRELDKGRKGPTDIYLFLALLWAASVGAGSFLCLTSGDWVAATLACLSAGAMVGGICFRNYGAPRLVGGMIALSLGPCAIGGLFSGELILLVACVQIPFYMVAMTKAAFRLNAMLVGTMVAEQDSAHRARHDVLTGLLNRAGLDMALANRSADNISRHTTFLYIDLDGFKAVNDSFGHAVGDKLLQGVAERLSAAVRPGDVVARLGGDEFLVVTDHADDTAARHTGDRLIETLSHLPYVMGEEAALIGACVGIALLPRDSGDFEALLAKADAALYEAKARRVLRCTSGSRRAKIEQAPKLALAGPVH